MHLVLPPHYRFHAMIDAHGWPQLAPFAWNGERGVLQRVEQLAGGAVVEMCITSSGATLDIDVMGTELSAAQGEEVERVVRWMVELDEDFEQFYAFCAEHSSLSHIPARGLGPMLRSPTVWEDYTKTVCTTNTTWAQTKGMVMRLVQAFGAPLQNDDRRAFPRPETIASAGPEPFAAAIRAGYRAPYIYATALEIAEGRLDLERFKQRACEVETEALMVELRRLRGIGPYGAAHLALLLGSYGHIPSDSWARELVRRHFKNGEPATDQEVHAHFAQFGRWRALAFRCWDWEGTA